MIRFNYTAIDAHGREESGLLEAPDARQAAIVLRRRGLFPTKVSAMPGSGSKSAATTPAIISPATNPVARRTPPWWPLGKKVRPRELAVLTRQLSTLLRAGMPLLRGLEVLGRQERNGPLRTVLEGLAEGIKSGGTLSDAMAQHPRVFDRLYLNMIKAGEAGGVLDVVLERLARFQEKSLQLKGKIKAAMVYPLIVMAVAVIILVGLLVVVVPKFKQIFADLLKGAPLPPLTQFVLTISDGVKAHYLIASATAFLLWVGIKFVARTPRGVRVIDSAVIRLPLFGELFLKGIIARFGRTLGTLLASGVRSCRPC